MKLNKLFFGVVAASALLFSCARQEADTPQDARSIRFLASVGAYQTKATDTAFEKGDAVGLIAGAPLNLSNVKLVWDGSALKPETELTWGAADKDTKVDFAAYYPYQSAINEDGQSLNFKVQPDQTTHALFTASDFMGAVAKASPAEGTVNLVFGHLLTKIVFIVDNKLDVAIKDVYMGNVYGQVYAPAGQEPRTLGETGTIKAGKVTFDGAEAYALIVAPGLTEPTIMVTTADDKQYTYTIEKPVDFQGGSRYTAKIILDENSFSTEFTTDIVNWTDNVDLVFNQNGGQPGAPHELNWTVEYLGCDWLEGNYTAGQIETIEVSNTDINKFYHIMLLNKDEDGDYSEILKDQAFYNDFQEEITEYLQMYADYYDMTFEELVPELFYNEANDGSELLFYGLPAGNYQIVVISMSGSGVLDGGYKCVDFSKDEDALAYYPWWDSYNLREDWGVEWDGWYTGYEGSYYWVLGNAAGASYIVLDSYSDDELDYYYNGNMVDLYNYTQSSIMDFLYEGYTIEELADYGVVTAIEEDGFFEDYLSTYGIVGPTNVYIFAFGPDGDILQDYGMTELEIPEYIPEPIDWVEREDWAINYDPTVDTGEESYPMAVVTTACDAEYFITGLYDEGALEYYGLDTIADDAMYYVYNYGVEMLLEYDMVHTSVPVVEAWSGLYNGIEAYIFGITYEGKLTGEWHMENLTGIEGPEPIEWVERTDWAINYDETVDTGEEAYPMAVVTTACDAEYFITGLYNEGALEYYGLDTIAEDAMYYVYNYGVEMLLEYDMVHTSVPAVEAWAGLYNGIEAYIFGITFEGELTGEWHMENLTGIPEVPPVEYVLQEDWSIIPSGELYEDEEEYLWTAVTPSLPGIKYYLVEEDSDDDLDYYYGGSVEGLAESYADLIRQYIGYGYTVDDICYSEEYPIEEVIVWNTDIPTTIYVIEFDEAGNITGRYGATDVVISSGAEGFSKPAAKKQQFTAKKDIKLQPRAKKLSANRSFAPRTLTVKAKNTSTTETKVLDLKSLHNNVARPELAAKKHNKAMNTSRMSIRKAAPAKAAKAPKAKLTLEKAPIITAKSTLK